jgi:hypothetical protein
VIATEDLVSFDADVRTETSHKVTAQALSQSPPLPSKGSDAIPAPTFYHRRHFSGPVCPVTVTAAFDRKRSSNFTHTECDLLQTHFGLAQSEDDAVPPSAELRTLAKWLGI